MQNLTIRGRNVLMHREEMMTVVDMMIESKLKILQELIISTDLLIVKK